MNQSKIDHLGYLTLIKENDGSSLTAGVLIVDSLGFPKEFRLTLPVEIDGMQKALYGETLESAAGKIFGLPLIRELKNRPSIFFVDDPQWLSLRTLSGDTRIFCLLPEKTQITSITSLEVKENFKNGISVAVSKKFKEDLNYLETILPELEFDLMEPFSRIRKAVELYRNTKF
jgi:hypothetical protein